jgi:hypothetical protein
LINRQQYEAQLQQIFRLLLENKTQEEIAHELNISTRTVARYTQRIDKRYGDIQRQKNDDSLFTECQLFKNRMLTLYKIAENKASDPKISGSETAKCIEVAANICVDVLKMESEGIKAVKELGLSAEKAVAKKSNNASINNLRNNSGYENDDEDRSNTSHYNNNQQQEEDDDRKF